jgi:hypothetical protein
MLSAFGSASSFILPTVGIDNRVYHSAKAFLPFLTTAGVMQFDALPFATDKPGFRRNFKMLGKG